MPRSMERHTALRRVFLRMRNTQSARYNILRLDCGSANIQHSRSSFPHTPHQTIGQASRRFPHSARGRPPRKGVRLLWEHSASEYIFTKAVAVSLGQSAMTTLGRSGRPSASAFPLVETALHQHGAPWSARFPARYPSFAMASPCLIARASCFRAAPHHAPPGRVSEVVEI